MSTPVVSLPAGESTGPPKVAAGERLVSLDAFRGFTMFWLMGGKAFILAIAGLGLGAVSVFLKYQLTHSEWEGLRYYDLIWPSFMLMAGVSVPFSFAKGVHMRHVWQRAAVLFLLGSLRESMSAGSPHLIELSSALQPIAIAYVVASYMWARSVRTQIAVAAGILAGYALLLAFVPAPGVPAGTYEPNHNLVTAVDQAVIGRYHPEGWGTVLSTIPTIATTLIGLLFGELLMARKGRSFNIKVIGLTGLGCLGAGLALSPFVPVIMKLWTTSYGLMSAGWACLLFLLFYCAIDALGYRRWALFFTVIGVNALAAYLGPSFVQTHKLTNSLLKPVIPQMGVFGPVLATGAVVLVNWLILHWMFRRKIFLRP